MAFALGLLIPALLIYLKQILDTKVHSTKDLDTLNMPFAGDIPLTDYDDRLIITKVYPPTLQKPLEWRVPILIFLRARLKMAEK